MVIVTVAWAACLLVVAFGKPASGVLRVSALLLAGYLLVDVVYNHMLSGSVFMALYEQLGIETYRVFITVLNLVQHALNIILYAFFFGAVSFSRRKPPKASPGAQAPAL